MRRATWVLTFVLFTALLSPLRDFTERNDFPVAWERAITFVSSAVLWVWTPYLLLGRRLPWRRLLPTGRRQRRRPLAFRCGTRRASTVLYSLGSAIYLPEIFTQNAERYGLIGIAFGIVSWLFGYAAVVITAAVVAGTWDTPPPCGNARRVIEFDNRLASGHE